MKTMKLIVLCLSLFLVSHSIFAQSSEKQAKYDKLEEKMAFLNDTIGKLEKKKDLNKDQKADLKFYQDSRDVLEKQIQKLFAEMVKEAVGGIPIQNERQKIEELTRRYWAKKLSWHDYVDQIFGKRSTYSLDDRKYALGLWEKKVLEGYQAIDYYTSEIDQIIKNLPKQVQELTGGIYTPIINQNNLKHHPHDPYYFSKVVNERVKAKSSPLSEQTKQKIQQTFNNAVDKSEELKSKQENTKAEVEYLQNALDILNNLCQGCKK